MILDSSPQHIAAAAAALRAGKLVGLPTETVYGLAADARNPDAVAQIFIAKGRPQDHPLIVHLADAEAMLSWASSVPKEAIALARAFWPGPLTLILQKDAEVSDVVTGGQDTIGLRVPDHPAALAVLRALGPDGGLAAPSANRFGRISPTSAQHVLEELGESVAIILDGGACQVGIESTILDLSRGEPVILRPGMIGADAIAAVIGRRPRLPAQVANAPRVSGALAAHYAPRTAMRWASASELAQPAANQYLLAHQTSIVGARHIQAPAHAAGYAHDLYANLRALDALASQAALPGSEILLEALPEAGDWDAVRDRLSRAVTGSGVGTD